MKALTKEQRIKGHKLVSKYMPFPHSMKTGSKRIVNFHNTHHRAYEWIRVRADEVFAFFLNLESEKERS